MLQHRENIRNIAIIAHVDHGKTTLVDAMLKQAHVFRENQVVVERVMDSNDLERERGITIFAKSASLVYRGVKINLVDTPGHSDFGGEVERVLNMVSGVLLLVDAIDGPMPQTKYVLRKALALGLQVIVVINKIDRPHARPNLVLNATFDLFVDLGATDQQADFPTIYTDAIRGAATLDPQQPGQDLQPLFDAILHHVPAPLTDPSAPTQMLISNVAYDSYKGRIGIGRLFAGSLRAGQRVTRIDIHGEHYPETIVELGIYEGLNRVKAEQVDAGEIVAVIGLPDINIGETVADPDQPLALPPITVDEPTVRMTFAVNVSPFAGREGTWSTSRKLRERLYAELERNISLRVMDGDTPDAFHVSGRGELHLAILIETMRREGYEFQVSKPEAIVKNIGGRLMEPWESVTVTVANENAGVVVSLLGQRRGELQNIFRLSDSETQYEYLVPTRGLLGFRGRLLTETRGTGVMYSVFFGYRPLAGAIEHRSAGSLVSGDEGVTTNYALHNAEERGTLFIGAGVEVYEGMIIGQHQRGGDLVVNPCKQKHLTNMRSSTSDIQVRLNPPHVMSLDDALEYIGTDELVEITPQNIRMRKRVLDALERKRLLMREQALQDVGERR
ncbi:MAG: translational GTPase TypA [Chloroflexi bacterium]|nr:translational GTPase TypA [Chloroflexota bacterium]